MNLEGLQNIPLSQRIIVAVLGLVVIVGGFIYFVYIPKNAEIEMLQGEVARLTQEVQRNENKVKRLDELKKAYVLLKQQLEHQMEQLPPEAEVPVLLKQISELGIRMGLDIHLWKPVAQRASPTGLYTEVPVDVQVSGGYHSVAMFFDRISRLRRIVNVTDLDMANPKIEKGRVMIQINFQAVAFALLPGGEKTPPDSQGKV